MSLLVMLGDFSSFTYPYIFYVLRNKIVFEQKESKIKNKKKHKVNNKKNKMLLKVLIIWQLFLLFFSLYFFTVQKLPNC